MTTAQRGRPCLAPATWFALALAATLVGSLACSGARLPAQAPPTRAPSPGAVAQPSAPGHIASPDPARPEPSGAATLTPAQPSTASPMLNPTLQAYLHSFTGTWDSTWGFMSLAASGTRVTGFYEYDEGRIEAALSADGRTLEGTWAEAPTYEAPRDAGRVVFTISGDGNSLQGYWWYGQDGGGREWLATRISDTPATPTAKPVAGKTPTASPAPATSTSRPQPSPTSRPQATRAPAAHQAEPGLTLSSDPDNDLLFYVTTDDGSHIYYYGTEDGGTMRLTHIAAEDGAGDYHIILFDERLLPIQWILSTMTVAIYPSPEDGAWFDPHNAFHVILTDEAEATFTIDMQPGDLAALLDEMEAASGRRFAGARGFLDRHPASFEQLVDLARQGGPDQPFYIAAAAGFSTASAALRLDAASRTAAAIRAPGLAAPQPVIFGELVKVGAGALAGALAGAVPPDLDPGDGPAVRVLLCRGAAKYGMCHYMFYRLDRLGACIRNCHTSLRCFTDICMPMDISAEAALRLSSKMAGR